jgi:ABC-type transport system substrate-binding protein
MTAAGIMARRSHCSLAALFVTTVLIVGLAQGAAGQPAAGEVVTKGNYAYGGYPDLDDMFQQQARERNVAKREALLHQIQQLTIDRAMYVPVMDYRTLRGVGPRMADHALDALHLVPFPALEEMRLKSQ